MDESKKVTTTHEQRKTYSYALGNVTLSFTLTEGKDEEKRDFMALLKQAVEELGSELKDSE